jgi:hypothetical protein
MMETVDLCPAPGSAGQGRLDLESDDPDTWMPVSEQETDRPVSAAEIEDSIARPRRGKGRQQERIHRMAKAVHTLDDP